MPTILMDGRPLPIKVGETILDAARRALAGEGIISSCPGTGVCRDCIVQIRTGHEALTEPRDCEAFLRGRVEPEGPAYRLACQAALSKTDIPVEIETFKRKLSIATTGRSATDALDPWVRIEGTRVLRDDREMAVPANGPMYGLAIDVGTTTVVLHVVDLKSGETTEIVAFENPQRFAGTDVVSRIAYDRIYPGQLHRTIIARINSALQHIAVDASAVYAVTVAGNPTMRDLFFGLDVQSIGESPFMSRTQCDVIAGRRSSTSIGVEAESIGLLTHPRAWVYGLPLISHHVGADTAAVLATIPLRRREGAFMVIDLGTNTEVVAGRGDRIVAASCAAGPAFEGGRVSCGMPASDGAVTRLRREEGRWSYELIGEGPARGVCGTGLVELLAELRASHELDSLGRFTDGSSEILIADRPRVAFSRQDASQLAQTKAAISLGQAVLLRRLGFGIEDIEACYLAGAFANQLDLERSRRIGLLLSVADKRMVRIGNAAIEGAKAVLLSRACRRRVESLVTTIEHIELQNEPDFFDLYAEMTMFEPIRPFL